MKSDPVNIVDVIVLVVAFNRFSLHKDLNIEVFWLPKHLSVRASVVLYTKQLLSRPPEIV